MAASRKGHLDVVRRLLSIAGGINVNLQDNAGQSALILASSRGHLEVVNALLAAGANVHLKTTSNGTARFYANKFGYRDVVTVLRRAEDAAEEGEIVEREEGDV